jgi:hypothetical protein
MPSPVSRRSLSLARDGRRYGEAVGTVMVLTAFLCAHERSTFGTSVSRNCVGLHDHRSQGSVRVLGGVFRELLQPTPGQITLQPNADLSRSEPLILFSKPDVPDRW